MDVLITMFSTFMSFVVELNGVPFSIVIFHANQDWAVKCWCYVPMPGANQEGAHGKVAHHGVVGSSADSTMVGASGKEEWASPGCITDEEEEEVIPE